MAEEFRDDGIAVNALWPRTMIATAAVQNLLGGDEAMKRSRRPEIVADAAHAILVEAEPRSDRHFYIDDEVLAEERVSDLSQYSYGDGELGAGHLPGRLSRGCDRSAVAAR